MKAALAVLLALGAVSCNQDPIGDPGVVCTAIAMAGLGVDVKDETTSQPICDATVTATEGTYSERLVAVGCTFAGAFERTGTYTVRAEKAGFAPKEVGKVVVVMDNGVCPHVRETRLSVALVPLGAPQ
jgi:hypothetical protein